MIMNPLLLGVLFRGGVPRVRCVYKLGNKFVIAFDSEYIINESGKSFSEIYKYYDDIVSGVTPPQRVIFFLDLTIPITRYSSL